MTLLIVILILDYTGHLTPVTAFMAGVLWIGHLAWNAIPNNSKKRNDGRN